LIGLEYVLSVYNLPQVELAERLGIKKQNINLWVKQKQNIPRKYLPVLEELFGIEQEYFDRELTEIEKLEIQKEKLKQELQPAIQKHEKKFELDGMKEFIKNPVYDKEEINEIERKIEKSKLIQQFKEVLDLVDQNPYMENYKLILELLENVQHEVVFHKTVEALAHYYHVLPDWVESDSEQSEFEEEIFEVFDDHNF
jgi:transcriptional regulator with XRE-family HTH domain